MLLSDQLVAERILAHIDNKTTDLGDTSWREPTANYASQTRLQHELERIFRRWPTPFCPSAALPLPGSYVAREAAGTPLLAVRSGDGVVRVFRNACRHRGAQIACGAGRENAFVCPYHGWTYALDGALRGVPHEYGFPGLDKSSHSLVPVEAQERSGIVFVVQEPAGSATAKTDDIPPNLLSSDLALVSATEQENAANWKIAAEGFLEGYHIFPTHRKTFYPVQFDNLNVVEHFGRNSRIAFPYRNIERLRSVPASERRTAGVLTYVYHLFPNVMIATFPQRTVMVVLEPNGTGATRYVTYTLAPQETLRADRPAVERDADFVNAGAREDREMIERVQRGLASRANEAFEFGRFEAALVHFHRNLHSLIGDAA